MVSETQDSNLIPIRIGFSKPKKSIFPVFSWLIRMVEGTPYSHVYVRWFSKTANTHIQYEASGTMVHFICEEVFKEKINTVKEYEVLISKDEYKKLLRFCLRNAGKGYGLRQIFGIAWSKLCHFFTGKKVRNPFDNGRNLWVCSELIGAVLEEIGEDLNVDLDLAGPKDIDSFLSKWGRAKLIITHDLMI